MDALPGVQPAGQNYNLAGHSLCVFLARLTVHVQSDASVVIGVELCAGDLETSAGHLVDNGPITGMLCRAICC